MIDPDAIYEEACEERDEAIELIKRIRKNMQVQINDGDVRAEVKFNGGDPALLCPLCRSVVKTGVDPKAGKPELCPPGHGCGVYENG